MRAGLGVGLPPRRCLQCSGPRTGLFSPAGYRKVGFAVKPEEGDCFFSFGGSDAILLITVVREWVLSGVVDVTQVLTHPLPV